MQRGLEVDEEAVSPVIATVLLLAITVLLTSMVFVMFQGAFGAVEKISPRGGVSVAELSNGHHIITFTHLDRPLDPEMVRLTMIPMKSNLTSVVITAGQGDVYGMVGAHSSFIDADAGYTVTQGDYFVLNTAHYRLDEGNWRVTLFYENTGSIITTFTIKE
jgi:flagellin-like protein